MKKYASCYGVVGVEPYSKYPFSKHQSQQRIQILGYHIYVDAVIRDKIFNTQNNEFFNWKKKYRKFFFYRKRKKKTTPQHLCVAEDCMLLKGGVLYGFTGTFINFIVPGGFSLQLWLGLFSRFFILFLF